MCRIHSQGTQHGCGHYVITKEVNKRDCGSVYCMNSEKHPPNCANCPRCLRYLQPDYLETVTHKTTEYCTQCKYWFGTDSGPTPSVRKER